MDSLHAPCTPLKKTYDSCFNHWFEEYLNVAAPRPGSKPRSTLPLSSATSSGSATPSSSTASTSSGSSSLSSTSTVSSTASLATSLENADPAEIQDRQTKIRAKAEEYEKRCGDAWRAYRTCLETGLREKDLKQLIREAREEFPLKQPKEVDMEP